MRASKGAWGFLVILVASPLRADIPPPPNYVETCTLARQHFDDTECVECGASYEAPSACEKAHTTEGYALQCRTSGASFWTEIWCRPSPGATGPAGDPNDNQGGSGCGLMAGPGQALGLGVLLGALALAWAVRRRR